ncbi:hypothetical protein HUW62_45030 [Myxococcus sp. AM011]|uniref:hypothetical protein n=1 Tax=Myxococcus sp. AM011 TaxID=2745200 RepID=UPI001595B7C3|nr:hypothetical protein [Myxococcus sp. AM011]NVJ28392.1 hypothetical protein [Myxococcus sp. AM011]
MSPHFVSRRPVSWGARLSPLCLLWSLSVGCDASTARVEVAPPVLDTASAASVTTDPEPQYPDDGLAPLALSVVQSPAGDSVTAPVLTTLRAPDDVTVEFIRVDDESIAVAVGGPETSTTSIDRVMTQMSAAASPAALYLALSPTGTVVPRTLQAHSDAVVVAGNWKQGSTSPSVSEPAIGAGAPRSLGTCGGLKANGQGNMHDNHGRCEDWHRDIDEVTEWISTDMIGYGAYVRAITGGIFWDIQKRNCLKSYCDWGILFKKTIPQGHVWYFPYVNVNNDFKAHSRATTLNNNGVHQHYVSTCSDWKTRTNWLSSVAGGCFINFQSKNLYCNDQTYEGLDPSYIWTSFDAGGNGTPFDC